MGEAGFDGRVVIAGGSGFLGRNLARALVRRGAEVVVLSRSKPAGLDGVHHEVWDARTVGDWARHLDGARAAVNLAGRTVDCIKTPDHCDEILRSRVESTRVLGEAMRRIDTPPPVWVQMSTAHIYGDPPSLVCDEDSAFGYGLAPTVGKAWEQAFDEARPKDTRGVVLRTSFVLGREGGAMPKLSLMARLGLGGKIAKGTQGMSWIHEDDMDRLFMRAIENDSMRGVYVATAPKPVSNAEFMRTLRRAVGMPVGLPAMGWMVRLGAPLLLRTDPELALYGRYCVSRRLEAEGFEFAYPDLESALGAIYGRG
ncbi:MAG: TIGR01777 family oxidoreductase [Phycisphaerales bacterium JB058]